MTLLVGPWRRLRSAIVASACVVLQFGGLHRAAVRHVRTRHQRRRRQRILVRSFPFSCFRLNVFSCSYGVKEKEDVIAAAKFMKERGFKVIIAVGTSVGGASVILAAAEDKTIDGIISENPVAHAPQFASEHLQKMIANYRKPTRVTNLLLGPFYRLTTMVFLFRIGASLFSYKAPVDVIAKISPRPVLLMHGTSDDTGTSRLVPGDAYFTVADVLIVPCTHSQRLFEAAKEPKSLWLAADAWHCAM